MLRNLEYNDKVLFKDSTVYQGFQQIVILSKCICDTDVQDRYYLRLNIVDNDKKLINQGFLYFYIDFCKLESKFVGVGVNEKYRNSGVASLLISSWIQLCLDESIRNLMTNMKQRKPFVLHLLKKYDLELDNIGEYQTSSKTVYICKKNDSLDKYLIFKNKYERQRFANSKVMREDNYKIVDDFESGLSFLDTVCLSKTYYLQDEDKAYQKSLNYFNRYKK